MSNNEQYEPIKIGWLTIPNQIVFNQSIRPLTKFVLGVILSFQYQSQCYASNEWFADQFGVTERTIESVIKELRDLGYIETSYDHKTKKRFIIPANKTLWDAYAAIRSGNHAALLQSAEAENNKAAKKETKKAAKKETKKRSRKDIVPELKKIWET